MSRKSIFLTRICLLFSLTALLVGCQSANVAQPLTAKLAGNDPDMQLEFWHTLAEHTVTSNDEAFHGLLLYLDNKDDSADYAGRVDNLKHRQLLLPNFDGPANQAVTRGTLAVAIARSLAIKGGLLMHIFPSSQHYAVREMEYEGVFPASTENQTFSGTEFVGIIGKLEDYQAQTVASAH